MRRSAKIVLIIVCAAGLLYGGAILFLGVFSGNLFVVLMFAPIDVLIARVLFRHLREMDGHWQSEPRGFPVIGVTGDEAELLSERLESELGPVDKGCETDETAD